MKSCVEKLPGLAALSCDPLQDLLFYRGAAWAYLPPFGHTASMENGLGTGVGAQGPGRKSSQSWEDPACRLAEGVFGLQSRDSGHLSLWQGEDLQPSPSLTPGLVGRPVSQTPSDSSGRLHQWIISRRVESKRRIPPTDGLRVTHPEDTGLRVTGLDACRCSSQQWNQKGTLVA